MKNYIITIARGYGSGGSGVAERLSKELGVELYDRELLEIASEKSGINKKLFALNDENIKGLPFYKSMTSKGTFKGEIIPPGDKNFVSDENLFNYQAAVIREIASGDKNCIFVGRASNFVLSDMENVLKILIQAPLEYCTNEVSERLLIDREEAEKKIKKIDRERAAFCKYYTGLDWKDVTNYDIALNGSMGEDMCIEIIKNAIKTKFGSDVK